MVEGCPRIWGQGVPIGRNPEAFYTDLFVYCSVPTSYKRISAEVTHHYWWGCIVFLKWVRVENSLFLIVVMILLFCCFNIFLPKLLYKHCFSTCWFWSMFTVTCLLNCCQKLSAVFLPVLFFVQWRKLVLGLFWIDRPDDLLCVNECVCVSISHS